VKVGDLVRSKGGNTPQARRLKGQFFIVVRTKTIHCTKRVSMEIVPKVRLRCILGGQRLRWSPQSNWEIVSESR
jgi:hypothetical protein